VHQTPLSVETVTAASLKPTDVLVRIRAAGLCHTDLEVIEGSLRYPLPIVLGHEAAGVARRPGHLARQDRGEPGCLVSLGLSDAGETHPPRQLR
jgi:Zn-dependent alcohol dehydrogenase